MQYVAAFTTIQSQAPVLGWPFLSESGDNPAGASGSLSPTGLGEESASHNAAESPEKKGSYDILMQR